MSLAVALFVAISAVYGAAMPWLTERLLLEGSAMRRRPWAWIVGLVPLALANIVGVLVGPRQPRDPLVGHVSGDAATP